MYLRLRPLWDKVVPRLLACGPDEDEDGYYFATRLIPNSRHLNLDTDRHLLPLLKQALQAVHSVGVVHGDLRCNHILVEEDGALNGGGGTGLRVWLIDFGRADVGASQLQKIDEMRELSLLLGLMS